MLAKSAAKAEGELALGARVAQSHTPAHTAAKLTPHSVTVLGELTRGPIARAAIDAPDAAPRDCIALRQLRALGFVTRDERSYLATAAGRSAWAALEAERIAHIRSLRVADPKRRRGRKAAA